MIKIELVIHGHNIDIFSHEEEPWVCVRYTTQEKILQVCLQDSELLQWYEQDKWRDQAQKTPRRLFSIVAVYEVTTMMPPRRVHAQKGMNYLEYEW